MYVKFDPERRSVCVWMLKGALLAAMPALLQACGPSGGHHGGGVPQTGSTPQTTPVPTNGVINITAGTSVLTVTKQADPGLQTQPDPRGTQVTSINGSGRDLVFAVDGVGIGGSSDKFFIPAGQHAIQWHFIDQTKYNPMNPSAFTVIQTVLTLNVMAA